MEFSGFNDNTFDFLLQIAFNNNREFYEENKANFLENVKAPLILLESELAPIMLKCDPNIRTGRRVISRIFRDTRFSKDKSMFRDHMWIGYTRNGGSDNKTFGFYFEITPVSYGYGMGSYGADAKSMEAFRQKIMTAPNKFLRSTNYNRLLKSFEFRGEDYKRLKYKEGPKKILDIVNKRYFYFSFSSNDLDNAKSPKLKDEVINAFNELIPLYKFFVE